PQGLEVGQDILDEMKEKFGTKVQLGSEPDFSNADVVYVVRVQEERFADKYEAKKIKEKFRLRLQDLEKAKKDVIVLQPLPKTDEISREVDESRHARYFQQAANAVPVRMAIIEYCLDKK
ncbi:MAG: aspartate carbamoyltransferase, partial [Candidatus ainarchaeum sp.]|nr:aspartate carbamoyltransferase [Candidatus ainarchaeum sp.]